MSEYQYYEFQAIDRPLTSREMSELRAVSSRANITATRFTNHYEWGDFKGDPAKWMEKYFDAFLYVVNWGTHDFRLRLPKRALDFKIVRQYLVGDAASARHHGEHVILDFQSNTEDYDDSWDDDGSGWLSSLIPLRNELARGDRRALYLGWLLAGQDGDVSERDREPPVPAGLGQLTAPLQAFVDFLRIDEDLIAIAAERSAGSTHEGLPRKELARLVAALPEAEKTAFLVRVAEGNGGSVQAELLRRFRPDEKSSTSKSRTFGELRDAAERRAEERHHKEAEDAARQKARRDREEAAAREKHLEQLAKREPAAWDKVDALVATKKPKDYDEAVRLLVDLRDLGEKKDRASEVQARIERLRETNTKRSSFIDRLRRAGLIAIESM